MTTAAEPRSLCVQTILYHNDIGDVSRAIEATAAAAARAVAAGSVSTWQIALGDCSATPSLPTGVLDTLSALAVAAGGSLTYEFFNANLGHGGGHNRLALSGDSDLILILNPDAHVGADTLADLAAALVPGVGAADGRQLPLEHPKFYDGVTGDTSWASGACLMTTRLVFTAIGGFDHETFFMYCDDVDYSWRARLHGDRVIHVPIARVFHDKRLTVTADWEPGAAELYYSAEAAVLLAHKYSRNDIVRRVLGIFRREQSPVTTRVIAEYERRRAAGELPMPIDQRHEVGEFTKGNYAVHRF